MRRFRDSFVSPNWSIFMGGKWAILNDKISAAIKFQHAEIQSNSEIGDDHEWAERAEFWIAELNRRPKNYRQKRRQHLPLILAGHGVRMNIDNGTLLIRNGFTHHPQKPEQYRYFRGDRLLPSRIVMLDGDGYLTFDVLAWLSEQNIPLIQLDWMGSVIW